MSDHSQKAIQVAGLSFTYGDRIALDGMTFSVDQGEVFGVLGPNGSGKSTLFRVLATLLPVGAGKASVCGYDVATETAEVRRRIGVTFQSASLDRKLTVWENLKYQGQLYGLTGAFLKLRIAETLNRLGISDRVKELVGELSGGLQRRVEIAKCLLHRPALLLLDEPSTGLDPRARLDLWSFLSELRQQSVLTIVVTTHLLDEAEQCDRLAILNEGQLVALDAPSTLRAALGGDCLTIRCRNPDQVVQKLHAKCGLNARVVNDYVRLEHDAGHHMISSLVEHLGDEITSITLGRPTLEDVFVHQTGRDFS